MSDYRVNKHIRPIINGTTYYYAAEHQGKCQHVHHLSASLNLPGQRSHILWDNCTAENHFNSCLYYLMDCVCKQAYLKGIVFYC